MEDDAPGVPEWVVTYGDMMSLLLTFFIMLVSLSEVVADKKYRAILESLQKYTGYRTSPSSPPGKNFPLNSMVLQLESLGSFTNKKEKNSHGGVRSQSVEGQELRVLRSREGKSTRVGLPVLFDAHSAELDEQDKAQLLGIIQQIAGKPNKIEIRAHASSDPLPENSAFPDKCVLTYQRARNVLNFFEAAGIAHERLRIAAASDVEPPQTTGDKVEAYLDRVEILALDAYTPKHTGSR